MISGKIQEKGDRIAEASEQYEQKHKLIETKKKKFCVGCVKEWKNRELGKGLYDISSSDEDNQKEVEDNQFLHLSKKEREKLEEECTYISEQIVALGGLQSDYKRERNNFPKDSYDYAVLDRERVKVDKFRRVYEHKLRERERILQRERLTFEIQADAPSHFTVQPFAYTSCTSRLRAPQGSHRMGDQWPQVVARANQLKVP